MTNQVRVTVEDDVFNEVYLPHRDNQARRQIFFGGSSSGKSVFLAQRCVEDLLAGGRNYLICREVGKYLRKSVMNEIEKVIISWGVQSLFVTNKSEMTITCRNGYQAMFVGLDDEEKIKSITPAKGVITDIWIEEATETTRSKVKQLNKRLRGRTNSGIKKRFTMSFNPILQDHWIYEDYFGDIAWSDDQTEYTSPGLTIQKTWYIHNAYLDEEDMDDLEDETDEYYYQVYTLGNWGILGNVIFSNWEVRDLSEMLDQFDIIRAGLDFGYSNDPAAAVISYYDRKKETIYIFNELYELEMGDKALSVELQQMLKGSDIVCDSSEPKSIDALKGYGIKARGAVKGPDSVLFGIKWLQTQKIVIDKFCINAKKEFSMYHWRETKDGKVINKPVQADDHIIDALRYSYEDEMIPRERARFIKVRGV